MVEKQNSVAKQLANTSHPTGLKLQTSSCPGMAIPVPASHNTTPSVLSQQLRLIRLPTIVINDNKLPSLLPNIKVSAKKTVLFKQRVSGFQSY